MNGAVKRLACAAVALGVGLGLTGCTTVVSGVASAAPYAPPEGFPAGELSGGTLEYGESSAPAIIDVWSDLLCPACGTFHNATAQTIEDAVIAGDAQLRIHFVGILAKASNPEGYSLRAGGAVLCAAEYGVSYQLMGTLYDDQPTEGGPGLGNSELTDKAKEVGAPDEIGSCIDSTEYVSEVMDNTDEFSANGYDGTPTVLINGVKVEDPSPEGIAAAIEGA